MLHKLSAFPVVPVQLPRCASAAGLRKQQSSGVGKPLLHFHQHPNHNPGCQTTYIHSLEFMRQYKMFSACPITHVLKSTSPEMRLECGAWLRSTPGFCYMGRYRNLGQVNFKQLFPLTAGYILRPVLACGYCYCAGLV